MYIALTTETKPTMRITRVVSFWLNSWFYGYAVAILEVIPKTLNGSICSIPEDMNDQSALQMKDPGDRAAILSI
ncbi:uncharacterized protein K444DRAFT_612061 [Hyaloscypha bicolor E]|uniref:Uncharacterized protein n=1 Tax=Hyaloscypha bicolor E TaxID=1095630 RepID=A0A2J6TFQ8_9HELO|nr:uncharacterized protein K444DRAFT_612061 [Hyaloscypha bicolor E]PMD61842.1 hypothetical protein K444DRAFT_612061 [Hyaloscypha bicolor E]